MKFDILHEFNTLERHNAKLLCSRWDNPSYETTEKTHCIFLQSILPYVTVGS